MGLFNDYSSAIEQISNCYHLSHDDSRIVLECIKKAKPYRRTMFCKNDWPKLLSLEEKLKDYYSENYLKTKP